MLSHAEIVANIRNHSCAVINPQRQIDAVIFLFDKEHDTDQRQRFCQQFRFDIAVEHLNDHSRKYQPEVKDQRHLPFLCDRIPMEQQIGQSKQDISKGNCIHGQHHKVAIHIHLPIIIEKHLMHRIGQDQEFQQDARCHIQVIHPDFHSYP